jgi:hypothetical protein
MQFMLTKCPLLLRFCSKLLYELLPATIASVVGGLLFSHYAKPPVALPATAMTAPANTEMIQMVRDEHALFIDYLKKYTDERHQADLIAEKEAKTITAAGTKAVFTARKARPAEAKAFAVTAHFAARLDKNIDEKQSAQYLNNAVTAEPLQLRPVASGSTQLQHVTQLAAPPAVREIPIVPSNESGVMVRLRAVTAMVGEIPSWVHSATKWFSESAPPRPPAPLLERSYISAATY